MDIVKGVHYALASPSADKIPLYEDDRSKGTYDVVFIARFENDDPFGAQAPPSRSLSFQGKRFALEYERWTKQRSDASDC